MSNLVRQTTKTIILEVLGVISLLVISCVVFFLVLLSRGPIELAMLKDDVERGLTSARNGKQVEIDRLTLQWSLKHRRVYIVADGLSLFYDNDDEAGWAERAEITLDAGAALLGRIEVIDTDLYRGWLYLQNTGPNQWTLAGEPLPELAIGQLPQTPQEWLNRTNEVLSSALVEFDEMAGSFSMRSAGFDQMQLVFMDANRRELATIEDASGAVRYQDGNVFVSLAGAGEGVGLPDRFEMSMDTTDSFTGLRANLDIGEWPLIDLLDRFGFQQFAAGTASVGTHFAAAVDREDGLEELDVLIARQTGELTLHGIEEQLSDFNLYARYRPLQDEVILERLDVTSAHFASILSGSVSNITGQEQRTIELSAPSLKFDLSQYFPSAWSFNNVRFSAEVSNDFSRIDITELSGVKDGVGTEISGRLDLVNSEDPAELPFDMALDFALRGDFGKTFLLDYWPVDFATGGRDFLVDRLLATKINGLVGELNLSSDSLIDRRLDDEELDIKFAFQDTDVRYMSDLPPVEQAHGTGWIRGNSMSMSVVDAVSGGWGVNNVTVEFPQFTPRGEKFTIEAAIEGEARALLESLAQSRFWYDEDGQFQPEDLNGQLTANFRLDRPALRDVSVEDVDLKIEGKVTSARITDFFFGIDVDNSTVDFDVTQDRMIMSGFGDLGSAPIQFAWRDMFRDNDAPASVSATAIVNADLLNRLGLVGRAYLNGDVPIEVQGEVGAQGISQATFSMDFSDARIAIDEMNWVKPVGEAARASVVYNRIVDGRKMSIRAVGDSIYMAGALELGVLNRLERLEFERLYLKETADISGVMTRTESGGAELSLNGDYLDVSPLLANIQGLDAAGSSNDNSEGFGFPIALDADVNRLILRRGLELDTAGLKVTGDVNGISSLEANGTTLRGARLGASYNWDGTSAPTIGLSTSDAGFVAEAFLGLRFMRGGNLSLSGQLGTAGQPATLMVELQDTRISEVPVVTQILSLASLRGLADTLSGDGVLFSDIVIPISIINGRYIVEGGRASGPALGLTMNGFFETETGQVEADGVLVPSFGVNSVLGAVPIIGDLFVGRRGEGIFSITYSVAGTFERAQVAVNPLSAVTPGILRRIFENPSDTSIPSSLSVDPSLRPPTETLPPLPDDEYVPAAPGLD